MISGFGGNYENLNAQGFADFYKAYNLAQNRAQATKAASGGNSTGSGSGSGGNYTAVLSGIPPDLIDQLDNLQKQVDILKAVAITVSGCERTWQHCRMGTGKAAGVASQSLSAPDPTSLRAARTRPARSLSRSSRTRSFINSNIRLLGRAGCCFWRLWSVARHLHLLPHVRTHVAVGRGGRRRPRQQLNGPPRVHFHSGQQRRRAAAEVHQQLQCGRGQHGQRKERVGGYRVRRLGGSALLRFNICFALLLGSCACTTAFH